MQAVKVLFVCAGPGVRARIAEAFMATVPGVEAYSAQFEDRDGSIPPFIVSLMSDTSTTLAPDFPVSVFERFHNQERYDYVITLCHASAKVICPVFRVNIDKLYEKEAARLSWSIQDFRSIVAENPEQRLMRAREIRDEIHQNVKTFADALVAHHSF